MIRSYEIKGKVQGVMFRQTIIRAALKRQIGAGATNDPEDGQRVVLTVDGDESKVLELITQLLRNTQVNSWGAKVTEVNELNESLEIYNHEVTTENVDEFNWDPNVEMYL